jgi:type IV secretion system protein VirB9
MKRFLIAALLASLANSTVLAADVPVPGEHDGRVRYVDYTKDGVTVINVQRGAVTRIVLGDDETIAAAATGFTADCAKAEAEWCVRADAGANQIWVKPKDGATHNNLELKTDKRDYSFEFRVLVDTSVARGRAPVGASAGKDQPMFRVIFRYPFQAPPLAALMTISAAQSAASQQSNEKTLLSDRLNTSKPVPRNWKYSMQALAGADEIAPSLVFDDGRFTYFRFAANREVPTIFYISPTGEESRINFHMDGDLAVVQRLGRRFVLRLGKAVVGVWNEAYDPDGLAPESGTTIEGVERTIR